MGFVATTLENRGLLTVEGPDALHFLQNLVTANVELGEGQRSAFSALLTPQGKILWDFFIYRTGDESFVMEVSADELAAFTKRMTLYKLRAKVSLTPADDMAVVVAWGDDLPSSLSDDPRLAALGKRGVVAKDAVAALLKQAQAGDEAAYRAHRISLGVPQSGEDFALGDVFPHDVNMDSLHGVDFKKGCYVGQEVVSRMKHRGTARKRFVLAEANDLPEAGTELMAGEKPVGTMGSSEGGKGLALVRLDRVKAALDAGQEIMAGDSAVSISLPAYATFDWPSSDKTER